MALGNGNVRTVDSKGRITLGPGAAGRSVHIEQTPDGFNVRYCRVIPESEAWLWENEEALKAVLRGIEDVKAGRVARDVDLAELIAYAESLPDEEG